MAGKKNIKKSNKQSASSTDETSGSTSKKLIDDGKKGVEDNPALNGNHNDEIPSDVLKVKERLERETGKKYRYRPANTDIRSVSELLSHGVPGVERKKGPKTWKETILGPLLIALAFAITLIIYHFTVLRHPSNRVPYKYRKTLSQQQYQQILLEKKQQTQQQEEEEF